MPLQSTRDHYTESQRLTGLALATARRSWARMDFDNLDASFADLVGPQLVLTVTAAQVAAAESGAAYVGAALAEQGIDEAADGAVRPRSLAGVASDGRPLSGLLRAPVTATKQAVAARAADPLTVGRNVLDMIVQTQVSDARRVAASVSMTARPAVRGYVRVVNLPACGRCLILAGRYYKTEGSSKFLRHPRCDCTAEPTNEESYTTDPMDGFGQMSTAEQDKAFGKDGAQAIRDGADMGQVVNARRGMSTTSAFGRKYQTTTEGISSRGQYGRLASDLRKTGGNRYRTSSRIRLMPESIYEFASDRADAVRLLRRYGYIT